MNYLRQHLFLCLLVVAASVAIGLTGCGGSSPAPPPPPPPPPPFVPQAVTVELGMNGGLLTLMTTQSGGYTKDGEPFQSGATVEANGSSYKLTLADEEWSAEYVFPEPEGVDLGMSGEVLTIVRQEDKTYKTEAGDTIENGGTWRLEANGSDYRLMFSNGEWSAEYVFPEPEGVDLGMSGEVLTIVRQEDKTYKTEAGDTIENGGTWRLEANGSDYRLMFSNGEWSAEYDPPAPEPVVLGKSGELVLVHRLEDGRFEANDSILASGDSVPSTNGNMYRLDLVDGQWDAEFVIPDPFGVDLGTSGEVLLLTRQEDTTYTTPDGERIEDGGTWRLASTGSDYTLSFSEGEWSAEYDPPAPASARLGASDERVLVTRREDGRYEADGELISSDRLVTAPSGSMYRLTLVDGEWTGEFVPQAFTVRLGSSDETISLVREEGGQYWLGRVPIEDGYIHATGTARYRLTFSDGEWTARYIPQPIQVDAGESGAVIVLLRLEDGTLILEGEEIRDGQTVERDGNEYVLTFSGGRWRADFTSGSFEVDLPGGGSVTLTKLEDGSYTLSGRVLRSGTTRTIDGVRYRFTLGDDGWTAVRRQSPTIPGDSGSSGGGSGGGSTSEQTETDERDVSFGETEFRLCDECSDEPESGNRGAYLEVGTDTDATQKYSLYDLLGRSGAVSMERTYVEEARERIEGIVDTIKRYTSLYEVGAIDPDDHINTGTVAGAGNQDGLWTQAIKELQRIFGSSFTLSAPWRGTVEFREVDDVIEELEEIVDGLSSEDAFELEFGVDAGDYFDVPMARIQFGSTRNTRFGAYANKTETDSADAASETWGSFGAFAYSPLEQPGTGELPTRGAATYRGDTVAVDLASYELYSGAIELNARFSTQRIDGTITDLDDVDGRTWQYDGTAVESVVLPTASLLGTGSFSVSSVSASVYFPPGSRAGGSLETVPGSSFAGQLVDEGSEAFGTWNVGSALEASFGVTRTSTGSVSGPSVNDRGAESKTYLGSDPVPDSNGNITLATSSTEFKPTDLYASKGGSETEKRFVVSASETIQEIIALFASDTTSGDRATYIGQANQALDGIFGGSSNYLLTPSDNDDAIELLRDATRALSSPSRFRTSLETGGVFEGQTVNVSEDDIFNAVPRTLSVAFDYTSSNYTRFGAWAETTLDDATGTGRSVEEGVFAYSPLDPAPSSTDLRFRAVYEGGTVAVDTDDGDLYRGFFQLAVDWESGSSNTVSSFIRNLRNADTNATFQHSSQDVTLIEFLDASVDDSGSLADRGRAQVHYQDGQTRSFSSQGLDEVKFVGESVDGPRGVIGRWSVSGLELRGAFGAELIP